MTGPIVRGDEETGTMRALDILSFCVPTARVSHPVWLYVNSQIINKNPYPSKRVACRAVAFLRAPVFSASCGYFSRYSNELSAVLLLSVNSVGIFAPIRIYYPLSRSLWFGRLPTRTPTRAT